MPTATATPTPTATPPDPADAADTLRGWLDEVMALSQDRNDILSRAGTPSYAASANEMRSLRTDVQDYQGFLESQAGTLNGYPAACETARQHLVAATSWLDVEAGWWIRVFEEWPFGDYIDQVSEAADNHFAAMNDANSSITTCALS